MVHLNMFYLSEVLVKQDDLS